MFKARALVPLVDDESFNEEIWAALLLGCGLLPQDYDPRVDALPDAAHIEKVQARLRSVADVARKMPSVEQFLGIEEPASVEVAG